MKNYSWKIFPPFLQCAFIYHSVQGRLLGREQYFWLRLAPRFSDWQRLLSSMLVWCVGSSAVNSVFDHLLGCSSFMGTCSCNLILPIAWWRPLSEPDSQVLPQIFNPSLFLCPEESPMNYSSRALFSKANASYLFSWFQQTFIKCLLGARLSGDNTVSLQSSIGDIHMNRFFPCNVVSAQIEVSNKFTQPASQPTIQNVLRIYHVPGTGLAAEETEVNKILSQPSQSS